MTRRVTVKLDKRLSVSAFVRLLDVPYAQVLRALTLGKVRRGVARTPSGRIWITDPDLAREDWLAFTAERRVIEVAAEKVKEAAKAASNGVETRSEALHAAKRELLSVQTAKLAQALKVSAGDLVSRVAVEKMFWTRVVVARTQFLGLPSKLRQRHPDLDAGTLVDLDVLIREILDELATGREATAEEARATAGG
jgi:hypothetical protein